MIHSQRGPWLGKAASPLLMALESRLLLDGAASDEPLLPPPASPRSVVFVDAGITGYQTLLAGLANSPEVVLLDPREDGIARITSVLANWRGVEEVSLISHGQPGRLMLGSAWLAEGTLNDHAVSLNAWQASLAPGADILLYGCDVGQGEGGSGLLKKIADLTGADVAASDNPTGDPAQGGDWILERHAGPIEAVSPWRDGAPEGFAGLLATYTVTNTSDGAGPPAGSLRQAVADANANPGADAIQFSLPAASRITLTAGSLTVSGDLTINGDFSGNDQVADVTIAGNGANFRAFLVNMGAINQELRVNSVVIDGFTPNIGGYAGAGFAIQKGTLYLDHVTLSNNTANNAALGGGVYLDANGVLDVTDSTLSGNSSIYGGGIASQGGAVTVTRSLLADNVATSRGGAIYSITNGGTLTVRESTLTGNRADLGGAVFVSNTNTVDILDATIANNTATSSGGGLFNNTGSSALVTVRVSIVADNTAPAQPDIANSVTVGWSLVENIATWTTLAGSSNLFNTDPALQPLADNGGPSKTLALGNASPAIDAWSAAQVGIADTTDQRGTGFSRYANSQIDIGAFERQAPVGVDDTAWATEAGGTTNLTPGAIASGNLLTNDTDADRNDTRSVTAVRVGGVEGGGQAGALALTGAYGSLTLAANGDFSYGVADSQATVEALLAGQTLTERFNYTVSDGKLTDVAVLTITIQGAYDAPLAVDDAGSASEAGGYANATPGASASGNLLANDTAVESGALTVTAIRAGGSEGAGAAGVLGVSLTGSYGTLTVSANGDFSYIVNDALAEVQALGAGASLTDRFNHTVAKEGLSDTGVLTITIQGADDAPLAVDDAGIAVEAGGVLNRTPGRNATGNLLANDNDPDGPTLTVSVAVPDGAYGTLSLQADGGYIYVVNDANPTVDGLRAGESLTDRFVCTVSDGRYAATSTLTITIQGADDRAAPVAALQTVMAVSTGGAATPVATLSDVSPSAPVVALPALHFPATPFSWPSPAPAQSAAEVVREYQNSGEPADRVIGDLLARVARHENVQQADVIRLLEGRGANHDTIMESLRAFLQVQKEARTQLYAGALRELDRREEVNPLRAISGEIGEKIPEWFPPLTGERIALLIGVNRYREPIPSLDTPIRDVTAMGELLRTRGYQTIILPDAGFHTVVEAFRAVGRKIAPGQDLLIYYAGHGYQREDNGTGYWLLGDARAASADKWLSTRHISDFLANIRARHILLVSDSCFSGSLTREYVFAPESEGLTREQILARRSVMMMSSGGEEPVMDGGGNGHSVFAARLLQRLRELPPGGSGFELFRQVRQEVVKLSPQTPQYGAMLSAGHEPGGDYLFGGGGR
ncbi:MAG: DUF4347 domain-containing protein [Magnetococcales bacterium]|nr:DUF4347 domain-containing protein [Magnetococcales bacterium]